MELSFADVWSLYRWAVLSGIVAGVVAALIGGLLLLRRTGFYGIVLPQLAATGVGLALALPTFLVWMGWPAPDIEPLLHDPHALQLYLLPWVAGATFAGLAILVVLGRRKDTESARVAATFAVASALSVVLGLYAPVGEQKTAELISGQILTVGAHEFEVLAGTYFVVLLLFLRFQRSLVLVSFDPDTTRVLGRSFYGLEAFFLLLLGATVTVGALIVGPLVLFGLLVLPPLAGHALARSMRGFFAWSALFGVLSSTSGVYASLKLDWPFGPALVLAAGAWLGLASIVARLVRPAL